MKKSKVMIGMNGEQKDKFRADLAEKTDYSPAYPSICGRDQCKDFWQSYKGPARTFHLRLRTGLYNAQMTLVQYPAPLLYSEAGSSRIDRAGHILH